MNAEQVLAQPDATGEVGLVVHRDFVCTEPFVFDNGRELDGFTLRYETYGRLNSTRTNAILICHALSGDHHCAGVHSMRDRKPGWWNNLIGPGKPVDTNRFFVVCSNCLGGCQGSTGPSSVNPATGQPFNLDFPLVTIRDMVRAQRRLVDHLGLPELYAVIGGSMGGMQVLQWGIEYPGFARRLLPMATTARQGSQAIAFNEVGRQAIMQDPDWKQGNYLPGEGPRVGLAIARMMAHITYLSDKGMDRKFGRRRREANPGGPPFDIDFEVESYLRYQGQSFINRFDANTYLYFTRALDYFDLADAYGSLEEAVERVDSRVLAVGFTSDWLFPPEQNREIALALLRRWKDASYAEIRLDLGHDSFLVEAPELDRLVRGFLES
ncbi:MAG: homoserine O-acetyltransferase [Puniceicoccaceae bacterium]|nr:MAG: homoserine O-acetyltransferase [Puniceicoccaceae bacterium]